MPTDNIKFRKAKGGKDFVGIKYIHNELFVYYPEAYNGFEDIESTGIGVDEIDKYTELIQNMLSTLSIARTVSPIEYENNTEYGLQETYALQSYKWIIEDYLKNGFYNTKTYVTKVNGNGRINWKRTLKQVPLITEESVFLQKLFVDKNEEVATIIAKIYKFCVIESIHLYGWLMGVSVKNIGLTNTEAINISQELKERYVLVVKKALINTFNDIHTMRLKHMLSILVGLNKSCNGILCYGVDSYHYVFEKMIDMVFRTENIYNYRAISQWSNRCYGSALKPDTIMKISNEGDTSIVIIDAKCYRFFYQGYNKENPQMSTAEGLPQTDSVQKQLTYGDQASKIHENENVNIYNCFILPYNKREINEVSFLKYAGIYATGLWRKNEISHEKIYVFFVDLTDLIKSYCNMQEYRNKRNDLLSMIRKIRTPEKSM